jgi:hypothetical protein
MFGLDLFETLPIDYKDSVMYYKVNKKKLLLYRSGTVNK